MVLPFQRMTGENSASGPGRRDRPWRHQPAPQFRTVASQITIAGPKNSAVYFDSQRHADGDADREPPCATPVSSTLARKNSTKTRGHPAGRIRPSR